MNLQYRVKNNILRFEKLQLRRLCDFGSVSFRELPAPRLSPYLACHGLAETVSFAGVEGHGQGLLGQRGPWGPSLGPPDLHPF